MSDPTDNLLSASDREDLKALEEGEVPNFHPILQVWRDVLKPAKEEAAKPVTPMWASRMVQSHPEVTFASTPELHSRLYEKVDELLNVLLFEISTDPECLSPTTPEEDVAHNADHYRSVLLTWQLQVQQWEVEWNPVDEHAAVELAAIGEVHRMFFSETGLVAFLDNIRFNEVYTEADQEQMREALVEARGEG